MKTITKLLRQFHSSAFAEYVLMLLLLLVLLLLFSPTSKSVSEDKEEQDLTTTRTENTYQMPVLDLPLRYFSTESVAWSSADSSAVDAGYQFLPTTKITLPSDNFSNEVKELPPTKTLEEILKQDKEKDTPWKWLYEKQIDEYGDLATRFLPSSIATEKFDVDGDEKDETIISLCGGGNHCPDSIIIVKDEKIIFSVSAGLVGLNLTKSDTGEWILCRVGAFMG